MTILFTFYVALSFYCLAGVLMEHFATFAGWPFLGAAEFVKVRTVQGLGSLYVYVVPKMMLTLLIVVQLVLRPAVTPAAPLWISLVLLAVSWAVSALVLVPAQLRLQRGKDLDMVEGLVRRDWIRVVAMVGHTVVVGFMVSQLLATNVT